MNLRNSRAAAAQSLSAHLLRKVSWSRSRPDAVYRTTEKLIGALELQKRHDETILLVLHSVFEIIDPEPEISVRRLRKIPMSRCLDA